MPRFYRLLRDNENFADRWVLDEPISEDGESIDIGEFCTGEPYYGFTPRVVPIYRPGKPVAIHLDTFNVPVVSTSVLRAILTVISDGYEVYPVTINETIEGYSILNIIRTIECVDEARCEVLKWLPSDNRPEKMGSYRSVYDLRILSDRVEDCHLFRIKGWEIALIVSEQLKGQLENVESLGVCFQLVT